MAFRQAQISAVPRDDSFDLTPLETKLDLLSRQIEDQLLLQRVALLEAGHILRFNGPRATRVALSLPDAQEDYLQRVILKTRSFYEARQLAQLETFGLIGPRSIVCDIGANIGNHTAYFTRVMGAAKVLAFEPMPHAYATLCDTIVLNQIEDRVLAYNCLLGAETGFGEMARFNPRNLGATTYRAKKDGTVALFALDDVLEADDLADLDLIKIDVEGMQMEVLMGAEGILRQRQPALWVECLPREQLLDAVSVYLEGFGYHAQALGPNDLLFLPK
jgi:FkbM family methyltransferase